jgi:DNA repair protein RecN (Recombination protein N)
MLHELTIKDVVLITDLHLNFKSGLSALTGETGAGKSILLDSMSLVLGGRAETGLIRKGCDKSSVIARFELPQAHEATQKLIDQDFIDSADIDADKNASIIIKRVLSKDGRSKAYINNQPVSVKFLNEIGESLVDIHGQFQTHGLMNSRNHGAYLDLYGQLQKYKTRTAALYEAWAHARKALLDAQDALQDIEREEQWLRTSLEELEKLKPKSGEEEQLLQKRKDISHHASIVKALSETANALESSASNFDEGNGAVLSSLNTAIKALTRISDYGDGEFQDLIARMDASYTEIADISSEIQDKLYAIETGGNDLDTIDERLHSYRVLSRKHRCTSDDLESLCEELSDKLSLLDGQEERIAALDAASQNAKKDYLAAAQDLSAARKKCAIKFDKALMEELPPLKLASAIFQTDISEKDEAQWSAAGIDRIQFTVRTNAGSDFAPLDKCASGGELSRIMLALKVVLSRVSPVPVMVFDEVDSGMGGATADALGERLHALANNLQVLVVTHAPQIAARARHHLVVSKTDISACETRTNVTELKDQNIRLDEIARMLSGAEITEAARAAAQSLIKNADKKAA